MPLILPGNVASATAATGYNINNSCRFNDDDAPKLSRTIGSDGSLVACTINAWAKLGSPTGNKPFVWSYVSGANANLRFGGDAGIGEMHFYSNRTGESPAEPELLTSSLHRDPAAWYNIHAVWDSANGTLEDRMRLYINGTRVTTFTATSEYPQSNGDFGLFNYTDGVRAIDISNKPYGSSQHFDGYIANLIVCDGQTYEPTKFGEFDDDSPTIWKPIDPSEQSLNFGTHGFWLDFADSSALGNDVSGNNNDFTVTNLAAADQASDSPTNNFCVMNPLDNFKNAATFSEGNCKLVTASSPYYYNTGTFGLSSGKWYYECKVASAAPSDYHLIGIAGEIGAGTAGDAELGGTGTYSYGYHGNNGKYRSDVPTGGGAGYAYGATYSTSIIGVYIDLDNNKLYFAKDGAIQNSGTGISLGTAPPHGVFYPAGGEQSNSGSATLEFNFGGCPAFAISSGNTDGTYGNFEYSPNDGGGSSFDSAAISFLAICTKNLAEYG